MRTFGFLSSFFRLPKKFSNGKAETLSRTPNLLVSLLMGGGCGLKMGSLGMEKLYCPMCYYSTWIGRTKV